MTRTVIKTNDPIVEIAITVETIRATEIETANDVIAAVSVREAETLKMT